MSLEKAPGASETAGATTSQNVPYTLFTKYERRCTVALIAFAGWFSTLSSFIYYPAISMVATDLNTTVNAINLTVTTYMVLAGIAPAIVGDASDNFGRRPLYGLTLTLYIAANIGIALQSSLPTMLVLRALQSAGISGTFSVAYGVIADIARPSERGGFVGAVSFGITTAPSIGPVFGGALAAGAGWRWIFWFLAISSGVCLAAMIVLLPETNRALVGNGDDPPPALLRPLVRGFMRPWERVQHPTSTKLARRKSIPNPLRSFRMLLRKDVIITVIPGSILYMVYCCTHTSLATTFIQVYDCTQLQAGLIYLPFGIGAIVSTIISGKWIDREYHKTAQAHGIVINREAGDDLSGFPIEEARMKIVFLPAFSSLATVIGYGWAVDRKLHAAVPLSLLAVAGFSIQTCFNINNTLVVDINEDAPASAQACFNFVRCILSAIFVGTLQEMIEGMGFGFSFTILGLLCILSILCFYIELRHGMHWRLARTQSRASTR